MKGHLPLAMLFKVDDQEEADRETLEEKTVACKPELRSNSRDPRLSHPVSNKKSKFKFNDDIGERPLSVDGHRGVTRDVACMLQTSNYR